MCGEQKHFLLRSTACLGSPPRVRGTEKGRRMNKIIIRITPACAGNRYHVPNGGKRDPDHPRVCGEQRIRSFNGSKISGSPPRVRGTGLEAASSQIGSRITPACAGNRKTRWRSAAGAKDHPRVCGEQRVVQSSRGERVGSPPRVRGTGPLLLKSELFPRITPACAGNSLCGAGYNQ